MCDPPPVLPTFKSKGENYFAVKSGGCLGAGMDNRRQRQNDKSGPDDGTAQSGAAEPLLSMGAGGRTRRERQNEESGPDGAASSSTSGVLLSMVAGARNRRQQQGLFQAAA